MNLNLLGLQDFHSQFFVFLWIQPHSGLKVFDSKQICFFIANKEAGAWV